eukprot:scaffold133084_cov57-Phaeocystis_antarctica.AAC.3
MSPCSASRSCCSCSTSCARGGGAGRAAAASAESDSLPQPGDTDLVASRSAPSCSARSIPSSTKTPPSTGQRPAPGLGLAKPPSTGRRAAPVAPSAKRESSVARQSTRRRRTRRRAAWVQSGKRRTGRARRGVRLRAATAAAATARPLAAAAAAPRAAPKRAAARGCHSLRPRRSPAGRPAGPRRHRGLSRASRSPAARHGFRVSWRPAARPHGGRRWARARRVARATKRWRRRCRRVARGSGASHSLPPPRPLAPWLTVPTRARQGKPPHSAARAPRTPRPRAPPPPDRARGERLATERHLRCHRARPQRRCARERLRTELLIGKARGDATRGRRARRRALSIGGSLACASAPLLPTARVLGGLQPAAECGAPPLGARTGARLGDGGPARRVALVRQRRREAGRRGRAVWQRECGAPVAALLEPRQDLPAQLAVAPLAETRRVLRTAADEPPPAGGAAGCAAGRAALARLRLRQPREKRARQLGHTLLRRRRAQDQPQLPDRYRLRGRRGRRRDRRLR